MASFAGSLSDVVGPPVARVVWLHAMGALALGMCTEVAYAALAGAGAGAAIGFVAGAAGAVRATGRVSARLATAGVAAAASARAVVVSSHPLRRLGG